MKRVVIRLFLAACAVLLFGLGALGNRPSSAQDVEEKYVYATAYVCDEHFETVEEMAAQCGTFDGASLSFTTIDGTEYGECVTENGQCGFDIPVDQQVFIMLTTPAPEGYYLDGVNFVTRNVADLGPDGALGMPIFVFYPLSDFEGVTTGMAASVAYCDVDPREPGASMLNDCYAAEGVHITFTNEAGEIVDECWTLPEKIEGGSMAGVCGTEVPLGSTTTATIDLSTTSADYTLISPESQDFTAPSTPPDGILDFPLFLLVANGDTDEPPAESTEAPPVTEAPIDQPVVEGRTVAMYTGDCDNIGEEVAILNDVLPEEGDAVGDAKAIPAELSVTYGGSFFLDEAIDGGYALVVYEDETTDTPVACGDLGGVNNHDGMLPIGLGEVDDSGIVGTAVLSYNAANELTTDVTIVISAELLPEPMATPEN